MKFTWKKVFGSITGSDGGTKPCPVCCVNCTPACEGYPDCNFASNPGCICGGDQQIPGAGPNICYCCKEYTNTVCRSNCPPCDCIPEEGPFACPCENCNEEWCDTWTGIWCTDCVWTSAFPPPIGNPGGAGSCDIVSDYKPYTYRIDLNPAYGGYTGFSNRITNGQSYGCPAGAQCGNGSSIVGGCDPDTARPYVRRYHTSPVQSQSGGITGFGVDYACLSWTSDKKSRVMVLSGRNVYRYTGFLSRNPAGGGDTAANWTTQDISHQCTSDGYLAKYYPWIKNNGLTSWTNNEFVNPKGISGISEMETLLSRAYPLADSVSGLPLWGQPLAGSFNNPNNGGGIYCGATHACIGCECLTASNGTIGHYDARGYTGSRVCFNPQAYVEAKLAGWERPQLESIPTGVPLCSVWSFVNSMLNFGIYQTYQNGYFGPNGGVEPEVIFDSSSSWIQQANAWYDTDPAGNSKTTPGRLIKAYRDLFAANPHDILSGLDGGTYYGNALSWHLDNFADKLFVATEGYLKIAMPSVFLWDETPYQAASSADKYKHLYIVGNANILFDSTCAFPSGATNGYVNGPEGTRLPVYETITPQNADTYEHVWATDDVRYHILRLDEVNHDNSAARPGLTANSARLVVFPGCSGGTAQFDVAIRKIPAIVVFGDDCVTEPTLDCPIYQIEVDESLQDGGIQPTECACAVCANWDNPLTWSHLQDNIDQRTLPACWANPQSWNSDPSLNRYFPHPYLITNPTTQNGDCRYFGPLTWVTGRSYFTNYPCRGYNILGS